jgi:hypothetical protein
MGVMNTKTKPTFLLTLALGWVLSPSSAARGEIVIDRQPHQFSGSSSDTEFLDAFGFPFWQRSADEVVLSSPAVIRRVTFWGYYQEDNPPASEVMRVRLYGSRLGDGLPDEANILNEQSFVDPIREWTGRIIFAGVDPREYIFQMDLLTPIALAPNTPYWIEISQIGNSSTHFVWENSITETDGFAFTNPLVGGWRHTVNTNATLALQLSTVPEPATGALLILSCAMIPRFRRPRR